MQKYLIGLLILFFVACSSIAMQKSSTSSQSNEDDKILWSSIEKLTWDDFKLKKNNVDDLRVAETTTIILTEKTYYNNERVPVYEIACYFIPKKSWTITSSEEALEHEQIHFDIGELYTRKIRKAFDSLNLNKCKDFKQYENLFNKFDKKCEEYNSIYDNEVYFNKDMQQEWIDRVAKELLVLKDYKYNPN